MSTRVVDESATMPREEAEKAAADFFFYAEAFPKSYELLLANLIQTIFRDGARAEAERLREAKS